MKVGVFGAGAIGGFLGGRLALAGHDVVLVGRRKPPLTLSDYTGTQWTLPPLRSVEAAALGDREAVLVTVKSAATQQAGQTLAPVLPKDALVLSLQNGVSNVKTLRAELPSHRVLAGMVPFNVLWKTDTHLHNGTSGPLEVERSALSEVLRSAGFDVVEHDDMERVAWTKLLVNLNNAVNALGGVPLREQLSTPGYRRIMARVLGEGLGCLKAAGIKPVRIGKLIPSVAPLALSLPNWLFLRVASAMVKVDPQARSSMWEDLERRHVTEVDYLNGEIVKLGAQHGVATPVNAKLVELIRAAERAAAGSPRLSADALEAALGRS
jgi:2-dehydropantoate 2-reductase